MFFLKFRWNDIVDHFPQRPRVTLVTLKLLICVFPFGVDEGTFDVFTRILVFCPIGFTTCLKEATIEAVSSFHEFFNIAGDKWTGAVMDLNGLHRSVNIEYLTKDIIENSKLVVYIRASK